MRPFPILAAAALAVLPSTAGAQRANRSISVESRASSSPGGSGFGVTLGASGWLDGDVHGTAAVEWAVASEPGVRSVAGSVGLAWAPGTARLRPRLHAEVGWRRELRGERVHGRATVAAGAGLEWFVKREVALTLGAAVQRAGGNELEAALGVRFGF
jgi:hypothetical protein